MRINFTRPRAIRAETRLKPRKLLYGLTASQSTGFLRGQAEYMGELGFEVHIVASPGPTLNRWEESKTAVVHRLPMAREISIWSDIRSLLRWLKVMIIVRPDIINFSTPKAALLGSIAASVVAVPKRVYVVRGLRFEGEQGRRRTLLVLLERLICLLATDIVVVSQSVGASMRRERVTRRPLLLIGAGSSNGVDQSEWEERVHSVDKRAVKQSLGIDPEMIVLLFVGRLTEDKGIGTLIELVEALEYSTPVSVVIVGSAESNSTLAALEASKIGVSIVGQKSDVAPYYAIADILVHPTKREGFPNVVLEAGSVGLPVVTTNATGAVDSVVNGITGFAVPVDDSLSMATAVGQLVNEPRLRRAMGNANKLRTTLNFRPESIWTGLEAVYSDSPCSWIIQL